VEERDDVKTPWGWLRGFAWFLLAWPLLSLLALEELDLGDWETVLLAMLAPAGIGVLLLLLDWLLERLFGAMAKQAAQPVPSTLRDLSNTGLTLAVLMGVDVALVGVFEDQSLFAREGAGPAAAWVLAGCFGGALVLRIVHRIVHGPARYQDLGEVWGKAPAFIRFMGYLTLIPTLLVCTVMVDYTLRGDFDYFGLAGWIALPLLLFVGLRSAMARSPRWWAKDPWEAWKRQRSLALPWWLAVIAVGGGFGVLMPVLPAIDDSLQGGQVIVGYACLGPLGLLLLGGTLRGLWVMLPRFLREWAVVRTLARDGSALTSWELRERPAPKRSDGTDAPPVREVLLSLRDGRTWAMELDDPPALLRWLEQHHPRPRAWGSPPR